MKYDIGLVDDHQLYTKPLVAAINDFPGFRVTLEAHSGEEMQEKIKWMEKPPDIILLDVNMPAGIGGIEVATWLTVNYPSVKLAAVSMNDTDKVIVDMFRAGCCSYMLKNTHPVELEKAMHEIMEKGYYNADAKNVNFRRLLRAEEEEVNISGREREFLQLACSDDTYKYIANVMGVALRTIDGYRDSLFKKLNVESRTGMVLEGIRKRIIVFPAEIR